MGAGRAGAGAGGDVGLDVFFGGVGAEEGEVAVTVVEQDHAGGVAVVVEAVQGGDGGDGLRAGAAAGQGQLDAELQGDGVDAVGGAVDAGLAGAGGQPGVGEGRGGGVPLAGYLPGAP